MSIGGGHYSVVLDALLIAFSYDAIDIILVLFRIHAVDLLEHIVLKEVYQRIAITTTEEQVVIIMAK